MRRILTLLLLPGLLAATLSSCCDCRSEGPAVVALALSPDSLSGRGFSRAEARSTYVVRYAGTLTTPLDTLRQLPAGAVRAAGTEYLPFTESASVELFLHLRTMAGKDVSSFRVLIAAANRRYELTDLDVKTGTTKGACRCVYLARLDFSLNGQRQDGRNSVAVTK